MRINYVFVGLWIGFFGPSFMHLVMSCMNVREAGVKVPNYFVRALVTLYT